jgi:hypothetical protein
MKNNMRPGMVTMAIDETKRIVIYCHLCRKKFRAPKNSRYHTNWITGETTKEYAEELFLESHHRHHHTNYDDIVVERRRLYRRIGFGSSVAFAMAKQDARAMKIELRQV